MRDEGPARSFPIAERERIGHLSETGFGRKPGNWVQTIGRIFVVAGVVLLLGVVGLGSLMVVWAAPGGTVTAAQIGVQACPANLSFSFMPTNPQAGETVGFTADPGSPVGSGVITFTWHFGDSSTEATGQGVDHAYQQNGVYQVTLTATGDTCVSQPAPATGLITVGFGTPAAIIYLPLVTRNYSEIVFPTSSQGLESP